MSECTPIMTLAAHIRSAEEDWKRAQQIAKIVPDGKGAARCEFAAFALLQILYEADALLRDALYDWDNNNE